LSTIVAELPHPQLLHFGSLSIFILAGRAKPSGGYREATWVSN